MPIRIRRSTPADEAAIDQWQRSMTDADDYLNLGQEPMRDPEAVKQRFLTWLRLPREKKLRPGWERIELVAVEDEGGICGYAALNFGVKDPLTALEEAYISELHVWPDYRKSGVAKGLLEMAEAFAVQRGTRFLSLQIACSNVPTVQMVKSLGFEEETVKLTKRVSGDRQA